MTIISLISRTLKHYFGSSVASLLGIAIATAVICGALIIGNSLKESLLQVVEYRLGNTTHTITAGERVFSKGFAYRISETNSIVASSVLKTDGIISVQGGNSRINSVNIWGIDSLFNRFATPNIPLNIDEGEAIISENIAKRLNLEVGDFFLIRIKSIGPIPSNTPFVSDAEQSVTRRVKVKDIASRENFGHFNLNASQTAPYNIFVDINWLNRVLNLNDIANLVLVNIDDRLTKDDFEKLSKSAFRLEDLNLKIEYKKDFDAWKLSSDRVFIEEYLSDKILSTFPNSQSDLTYFVNSIESKNGKTPYSFVSSISSLQGKPLKNNQVIINSWLANDLAVGIGDSLKMTYFKVGALRELSEDFAYFQIVGIMPMEQVSIYKNLMPHLPGLSDAGSCNEWDTGIPIDLELIRQKDEDYWDVYGGTPKAFVSFERGSELWKNRFGNLTSVYLSAKDFSSSQISEAISKEVDPFEMDFRVNEVRKQGIAAAKGGVDFSQLFAALGIFIIISGLLLTSLIQSFSVNKRSDQIELFAALGFGKRLITKIFVFETLILAIVGSALGLLLSIGYSKLIFIGLNKVWHDIVRTDVLLLHFNFATLIIGYSISILVSFLTTFIVVRRNVSKRFSIKQKRSEIGKHFKNILLFVSLTTLALSFIAIIYLIFTNQAYSVMLWFSVGLIIFLSFLVLIFVMLFSNETIKSTIINTNSLSIKNLKRNPSRSFTITLLIALGSFAIVVTAANRKSLSIDSTLKQNGTGGFGYIAQTTIPILRNLNENENRLHFGLENDINFVQFLSTYGDDASCLNLNRVANPRIIATNPQYLKDRFTFIATTKLLNKEDPWESLNQDFVNAIPAIADFSVIQWGLGKKLGDTLVYTNSMGSEVNLILIGGLANSVFQGNVIVSVDNFLKHFPATSGSDLFLIDTELNSDDTISEDIAFAFRDFGWEMQTTTSKLEEFNTIQNTYLRIFFLMGALGMLLGTIGLGIVVAKSIIERKKEFALFTALGYKTRKIAQIIFTEYFYLLASGIFVGSFSALIATLPNFLFGDDNVSMAYLLLFIGLIFLNGFLWIIFVSLAMLKRLNLLEDLRND
jgi:putative ABC transport system permease protein